MKLDRSEKTREQVEKWSTNEIQSLEDFLGSENAFLNMPYEDLNGGTSKWSLLLFLSDGNFKASCESIKKEKGKTYVKLKNIQKMVEQNIEHLEKISEKMKSDDLLLYYLNGSLDLRGHKLNLMFAEAVEMLKRKECSIKTFETPIEVYVHLERITLFEEECLSYILMNLQDGVALFPVTSISRDNEETVDLENSFLVTWEQKRKLDQMRDKLTEQEKRLRNIGSAIYYALKH